MSRRWNGCGLLVLATFVSALAAVAGAMGSVSWTHHRLAHEKGGVPGTLTVTGHSTGKGGSRGCVGDFRPDRGGDARTGIRLEASGKCAHGVGDRVRTRMAPGSDTAVPPGSRSWIAPGAVAAGFGLMLLFALTAIGVTAARAVRARARNAPSGPP
ncbi:hypothetical protein [Actinomadura sp. 21ATH]|uniref:hypothetical protein n=1 Tax=Actinomadura sp. 21ATH TaxID=1735444 RepID=UPI0035BFCE2A